MNREWYVKRTNPEFIDYLSRSASILPITSQILVNRGINTPDRVKSFLNPQIGTLSDPYSLPDMDRAIQRIRDAALSGESVLVHGDYDADGVTSTAIILTVLKKLGIQCDFFIPNRFDHGYGFNREAIDIARKSGATLIITVDCGINAIDEAAEAGHNGIDVIITDHHEPRTDKNGVSSAPRAHAVINPKLMPDDQQLPLCGAGIALMMAIGLLGIEESIDLFDLAAIGTVADMVPLHDDNRMIIKKGVQLLNSNKRRSLAVLREAASLRDKTISSDLLSYSIIPRINASGRLSDASEVVKLLLSDDMAESHRISRDLNINNARRQKIEENVLKEALAMLKKKPGNHCIVLHGRDWHEGVIGIVASKIADMFQKPAFIFSLKKGIAKGSARSIHGLDLCDSLSQCAEYLITFGGHRQAAGLTLDIENMNAFEKKISSVIAETFTKSEIETGLFIDAEVRLKDMSRSFLRELMMIEPFGFGNEEPLLAARRLEVITPKIVGNNHLKMKLRCDSFTLDAIGFNMGNDLNGLENAHVIDAAFVPTINEWNGSRTIQLNIKALRPSHI